MTLLNRTLCWPFPASCDRRIVCFFLGWCQFRCFGGYWIPHTRVPQFKQQWDCLACHCAATSERAHSCVSYPRRVMYLPAEWAMAQRATHCYMWQHTTHARHVMCLLLTPSTGAAAQKSRARFPRAEAETSLGGNGT
ncbi:hypothetical protein TRVL_08134 [Trypanosoma vivax]|nr:hypothetical protein TRVL_08134 [Trypanosoma vivax]